MNSTNMGINVLIVEDKDEDLRDVSNYLADSNVCEPEQVMHASTYDQANELIEEHSRRIDLVLLDLNIPRNAHDTHPEKAHGQKLLDQIHGLNRRAEVQMRVIVVSAELLADDHGLELYMKAYDGTLVGSVRKDSLAVMLKANLKRLRRDPIRNSISRLGVDVLNDYDGLMDTDRPPLDRLENARSLAICLARNEMDYFEGRVGASELYSDNLHRLAEELKKRFNPDTETGRPEIKAHLIKKSDGWGKFLWRGWHVDHLYILNNYRRHFKHESEQPYAGVASSPNAWEAPSEVFKDLREGRRLLQIVELIVQELLDWYLPWHEQVYLPWRATLKGSASK